MVEEKENTDIPQPDEAKPDRKHITRHLRAPIEIRIEVTRGPQSYTATSRNLAVGGVSFESMEPFSIGDSVTILMYVPVNKEIELLKASAHVLWVKEDFGAYVVGAAFEKFAPGDQKRLREWLLYCVKCQKEGKSYF